MKVLFICESNFKSFLQNGINNIGKSDSEKARQPLLEPPLGEQLPPLAGQLLTNNLYIFYIYLNIFKYKCSVGSCTLKLKGTTQVKLLLSKHPPLNGLHPNIFRVCFVPYFRRVYL